MAAAFRAGWSNSTPATPTFSVVTSTVAHDALVIYAVDDNTGQSFPMPTGFTQQASLTDALDGMQLFVGTKPDATGSEGTISVTVASGFIGGVLAFSGVNNTTPLDVAAVTNTITTGAASPWTISASITPVTAGCLIVAIVGDDVTSSADPTHAIATTSGTTGSWTTNQDLSSGFYNTAAFSCVQASAGAITVTVTGTAAGATAARQMVLMALRPAAGGGTTYNDTVSESVTSAFSPASAMVAVSTLAEAATMAVTQASTQVTSATISEATTTGDQVAGGLTFAGSVSESVTPSDSVSSAAVWAASLSEAVVAADSTTSSATFGSAIAEAVTPADGYAVSAAFASAIAESWVAGDSNTAASVYAASVSEGLTTTDFYGTGGGALYTAAFAEAVTVADALISTSLMQASLAEAIAANATAVAGQSMAVAVSEGLTLTDGSISQWIVANSLSEAIGLADAYGAQLAMSAAVGEQIALLVVVATMSALIPNPAYTVTGKARTRTLTSQGRTRMIVGKSRIRTAIWTN